jgi:hypothetical protein
MITNREKKFRIYDKAAKVFIYPETPCQQNYVLSLGGVFTNLQNGVGGNEVIVQEWIGRKDVDGKDIYEGDRVRFNYPKDRENIEGKIVFYDGDLQWRIEYVDEYVDEDDLPELEMIDSVKNVKVIGTVFDGGKTIEEIVKPFGKTAIKYSRVGSRATCVPVPDYPFSDTDILIYCKNTEKAVEICKSLGYFKSREGYEDFMRRFEKTFASMIKDNVNLLFTEDEGLFEKFVLATSVIKKLNLPNKMDRINVTKAILWGEAS